MSDGLKALLVVTSFALLGVLYFWYLNAEPFPPAIARFIPAIWLAGTLVGGVRAARALRSDRHRLPAGLALALGLPSAVFALVFALAALMGD